MQKLTWRKLKFAIENQQVTITRRYPQTNAYIQLKVNLPEPEEPIERIATDNDKDLVLHFANKTSQTIPLKHLSTLFPTKLSAEQLIDFDTKGDISITPTNNHNILEAKWYDTTTYVDNQNRVLAKQDKQFAVVSNNNNKGQVDALLTLRSEQHLKELQLFIFYANGCIESRTHFHYERTVKRIKLREKNARQAQFEAAQKKWHATVKMIDDPSIQKIINQLFHHAVILNARMKDNSELTELLNKIMRAIAFQYGNNVLHDFDEAPANDPISELMHHAKSFKRSTHIHGIIWGTLAMVAGVALAGLAALFFAGVIVSSGIGAIIVGLVTATAAATVVLTDILYIKDTYRIGRMRHELGQLIKSWKAFSSVQPVETHSTESILEF